MTPQQQFAEEIMSGWAPEKLRAPGLRVESLNPQHKQPSTKPRVLNPTRFLCRSEVRKFLLHEAARTRAHKFTRVSEETLIEINEHIRACLVSYVRRLPSKGKTI